MIFDLGKKYQELMTRSDPRADSLPLMKSLTPTVLMCLSYVFFVKFLGPQIMKTRKPLHLRPYMVIYNFAMVIFNVSMTYILWNKFYGSGDVPFSCATVDYSQSDRGMRALYVCYAYFISKFVEFIDTIFFVLAKKFDHVSTLHVIHHGIMPFSVWWGVKFAAGGHAMFFGLANSVVHSVMYIYYALAAIGPPMKKYLWWKRHVTHFQMIQFLAIFLHSFQLLFRECDFPLELALYIGLHGLMFLGLFSNFYRKAYLKSEEKLSSHQEIRKSQ